MRVIKFKNIQNDAATLGVSREHLYCVLTGRRQGAMLIARYNELTGKKLKPVYRGSDALHFAAPDLLKGCEAFLAGKTTVDGYELRDFHRSGGV